MSTNFEAICMSTKLEEFQTHWQMAIEKVGDEYFGTEPVYLLPRPNFQMVEQRAWSSYPSEENALLRLMIGLVTSGAHPQSGTIADYADLVYTEFEPIVRVLMAYYCPHFFYRER